jgi:ATP-dependent protease ClpP protease subunit
MPRPAFMPQMKAAKPKSQSWYRIENAHVDTEGSTDDTTKIFIYDIIGESWWFEDATPASEFVKQLAAIKTENIELHLNSPGGDIFDGTAIFNALKYHDARVKVVVDGLAASAASFIAQAGDEIVMREGSMMMIHDGSAGAYGFAEDLRKTADILDKLSDNIATIYSNRAGQTPQFWRDLMVEETWYNASEAVEAGLADSAEGKPSDENVEAKNQWLSFFNSAGRGPGADPLIARQRIANRLKENIVPPVKNENEQTTEETGSPQADPDANTTQGDPVEVKEEEQEQTGGNAGTVPDAPSTDSASNKIIGTGTPTTLAATAVVNLGESQFTVPKAVADHLNMLNQFRNETLTQARKDFVAQLAADNKILASQVTDMETYALSLTDDGFAAWTKLYDNSAALPMLAGSHAEGTSNHSGSQSQAEGDKADRIAVLKGIMKQHKLGKMSDEKIMEKPSYQELIQLDPNFKLSDI